jgi:drug/metabolite transporter (DMT)-like permease
MNSIDLIHVNNTRNLKHMRNMKHMKNHKTPTVVLFSLLGLLWGASFLLIKISLRGLNSAQVGLFRLALGAATLTAVMLVTHRPWPRGANIFKHLAVIAVFMFVLPVALYSWAGQFLPSSLSAVLNATTPLMTLIIGAIALRSERLTARQIGGVLLGAAGIILVLAPWERRLAGERLMVAAGSPRFWLAALACLAATCCYGCAYVWMRRFLVPTGAARDPVGLTAVQLLIAAALTAAISPWNGAFDSIPRLSVSTIIAILILGVFSTGLGYLWNTDITARWGSLRASQVTYLTPLVGIALGAVILHEPIALHHIAGTAAVLIAIACSR